MNKIINVGLIGNGSIDESLVASQAGRNEQFNLTKILIPYNGTNGVKVKYPNAEMVNDIKAIVEDSTIDLVIISSAKANDLPLVEQILQSGKHLRII